MRYLWSVFLPLALGFPAQASSDALLQRAREYEASGRFQQVEELAQEAIRQANSPEMAAIAWGQLGNAYLMKGDLESAIAAYARSNELVPTLQSYNGLTIAHRQQSRRYEQQVALLRGRPEPTIAQTERYRQLYTVIEADLAEAEQNLFDSLEQARNYARLALRLDDHGVEGLRALINAEEFAFVNEREIVHRLETLPPSPELVQLRLRWHQVSPDVANLQSALQEARSLENSVLEGRVELALAQHYERVGNEIQSLAAARQAQWLSQNERFTLFQAQLIEGRLHARAGRRDEALKRYQGAMDSLEKVRQSLLSLPRHRQLDFNQEVEPVYREYLELLLASSDPDFEKVLAVFDRLKLAQVEDFFGSPCGILDESRIEDTLNQLNAGLVTTIVLPRSTTVIFQHADGFDHHRINVSQEELQGMIAQWQQAIFLSYSDVPAQQAGQQLYRLLLEPLKGRVDSLQLDQLIFNLDGDLRSVPMAALHTGERYLVEEYPVSVTLGLSLAARDRNVRLRDPLIFGLSIPTEVFADPILFVEQEVEQLRQSVGGEVFLNSQFTEESLREELAENERSSALHIATHGIFGGSDQNSYFLAYDRLINLEDLEGIMRGSASPLDLLVLSACETALGNDRAVLGMAGIGFRVGIANTLGTLWRIPDDDDIVELIADFYRYRSQGLSYAEALQRSQVRQIGKDVRDRTPVAVWSSLVLLGS